MRLKLYDITQFHEMKFKTIWKAIPNYIRYRPVGIDSPIQWHNMMMDSLRVVIGIPE